MKRFWTVPALFLLQTAARAEGAAAPIDLTPLLEAVVSLALSLITAFMIPWIRARYSAEQRRRISAAVEVAVFAAEQLFGAGAGGKKLEWAARQLEEKGFRVDRAAIEAEVLKLKGLGRAISAAGGANG